MPNTCKALGSPALRREGERKEGTKEGGQTYIYMSMYYRLKFRCWAWKVHFRHSFKMAASLRLWQVSP